eukprot:5659277-Pleurochrysis_carterae.AAC.1
MINFNRRFIANLGEIADPLHGLLKKGVSADAWPWDQRYQDAYDEWKKALKQDCLQSHPDLHDPNAEF